MTLLQELLDRKSYRAVLSKKTKTRREKAKKKIRQGYIRFIPPDSPHIYMQDGRNHHRSNPK